MASFDVIKPPPRRPTSNFLPQTAKPVKKKSRKWKWFLIIAVLILAVLGGGYYVLGKTNKIFTGKTNIFSRFSSLLISPDKKLIGEDQGQINILLLGIGGDGHDGAHLTDTMMVANINVKTNEITLISIPRDFEYDVPGEGINKINSAYAYAYQKDPNTAGLAAISAAEQLTGMTIPYYAVVDFTGFIKAINDIGGVDVVVENTFTDATFPNDYPYDTKGYLAPVTFTKGPAHMDGRTALIFARSRHSENPLEGSDFARSERQKKIIAAVRDKVETLKLTDLSTINNLLGDFTDNFRTNLEPYEIKHLADLGKTIPSGNFYSFSLDPDGVLICSALADPITGKPAPPPVAPVTDTTTSSTSSSTSSTSTKSSSTSNSTSSTKSSSTSTSSTTPSTTDTTPTAPADNRIYVVLPCVGKTDADIAAFVSNATLLAKLKKESATIEIQNSTGKSGPTAKWQKLADLGVNIKTTTYKGTGAYDQTILYDNSQGAKPNTLDYIKSNFTVTTSDIGYPSSAADFVIVIGKDEL